MGANKQTADDGRRRFLRAIHSYRQVNGRYPSQSEMATISSRTRDNVRARLHTLWKRGLITTDIQMARSVRITPQGYEFANITDGAQYDREGV